MIEFLFKIGFNFYHHGQFRSVSEIRSGASNAVVHLEHAKKLFKSYLIFTTTGSSKV
jgi:hypothetical protein